MTSVATIVIFLSMVANLVADGKMFWKADLPSGTLPYQRAIIFHHEGKQTLLVQSAVQPADGTTPEEVAWVIPVPAVPEVGPYVSPDWAEHIFRELSWATQPQPVRVSEGLFTAAVMLWIFVVGGLLLKRLFRQRSGARLWWKLAFLYFLGSPVFVGYLFFTAKAWKSGSSPDVDVLAAGSVGAHDYSVVRSGNANALVTWLRERDFAIGPEEEAIIGNYVRHGWCFVATRLDLKSQGPLSSRLAAPILLRFPSANPVYPMALTGSGGHATEVLLHVFAEHPVDSDGKISRRFSGPSKNLRGGFRNQWLMRNAVESNGLIIISEPSPELDLPWLTTFHQTLETHEMREDIILRPNQDPEPYRRLKWIW